MITAERLEELIKQGATIYLGTGFNYVQELNFTNKTKDDIEIDDIEIIDDLDLLAFYNTRTEDRELYRFSELYETKERYDWHYKMTAERTERFEPPMWEDIKGYYCFAFILDNCPSYFVVKKDSWITIDDVGCKNIFEKYASDVTKENYIKACEIVRDLFNKGSKE